MVKCLADCPCVSTDGRTVRECVEEGLVSDKCDKAIKAYQYCRRRNMDKTSRIHGNAVWNLGSMSLPAYYDADVVILVVLSGILKK